MNNLFIKSKYLKELTDIFRKYCPKAEIWAYGSRVKNEAHAGSDLDLTIKTWGDPSKNIYELKDILTRSNIPFLIDINEFDSLSRSFQQEILKKYIKIYKTGK